MYIFSVVLSRFADNSIVLCSFFYGRHRCGKHRHVIKLVQTPDYCRNLINFELSLYSGSAWHLLYLKILRSAEKGPFFLQVRQYQPKIWHFWERWDVGQMHFVGGTVSQFNLMCEPCSVRLYVANNHCMRTKAKNDDN